MPFEECLPAASTAGASWVVDSLRGRDDVGAVIPDCFARCVRVHHALEEGRWADAAPHYLVRGVDNYKYPFPEAVSFAEGDMGDEVVDRLVHVLSSWTGDDATTHYGLWNGWGEFSSHTSSTVYLPVAPDRWGRLLARVLCRPSTPKEEGPAHTFLTTCPIIEWYRDMWLFDGPLTAATAIGSTPPWDSRELRRRSPQWWWPTDRSWFVANEIDWPWSYVAGPDELVDAILADQQLETVEVEFTDRW